MKMGGWMAAALAAATVVNGLAWEKKSAPIMTKWADDVTAENVLPEYPRPQLVRAEWLNLNGVWEFDGTTGVTNRVPTCDWKGMDESVFKAVEPGRKLPREILVPYPVESALSGIMERMEYMKYRRTFALPKSWKGRHVRLNFEAVDWRCEAYVNGKSVGRHDGGYDPFWFDVTKALKDGENELIVSVYDPTDNGTQPVGKQRNKPEGYWYTPNSGIWQTVWLEPVDEAAATRLKLTPHFAEGWVGILVEAPEKFQTVTAVARDGGKPVATGNGVVNREFRLAIPDAKPWTPDTPFLYDLELTLSDRGRIVDRITSYFGLRDVGLKQIDGVWRPTINGEFVFQLGTLDQGYWPDGNLRAPTDEALKSDIVAHKELGFNLIRKHIKVEPRRWFYWCDKIGMLVWQDMPCMHTHEQRREWGQDRDIGFRPNAAEKAAFERELKAMVDTHISAPSVVCWILFNEGWAIYERPEVKRLSDWLSAYDPTRLVNDSTGLPNEHASGDVYAIHIYPGPSSSPYPVLVGGAEVPPTIQALGEYGGAGLNVKDHTWFKRGGWAYGEANKDVDMLGRRYREMQDEIYNLLYFPGLSASMYTQITDVEGETNGIYTYDRKVLKFDSKMMKAAHDRIIKASKNLKSVVSANAGLALPPKQRSTTGGGKESVVFAETADGSAPNVAAAVITATVSVPEQADGEAGVAVRVSDEGGYYLGLRGDGTALIRGFGPIFGDRPPSAEKKIAVKGAVPCKVTAFGSTLGLTVGGVCVTLRDAQLPVGKLGVYAKNARPSAVTRLKVSNPAQRIRWIHGPVKFLVTRDERVEFVDAQGRKAKREEVHVVSDCNAKVMGDAYWEFELGLADAKGVSIRSMSRPGAYLVQMPDGFVNVVENDGSADFAARATWFKRPGNDRADGVSFESFTEAGSYLRISGRAKVTTPKVGNFRYDSTFELVD